MYKDQKTQDAVDRLLQHEAALRARAERRLIEQERTMRWGALLIALLCSVTGAILAIAGKTLEGSAVLAAATGSTAFLWRQRGADGPG